MIKYIIYKDVKIYDGDSIGGEIDGTEVNGKLSIDDIDAKDSGLSKRAHFCQNLKNGIPCCDHKGFELSWAFYVRKHGLSDDVEIYSVNNIDINSINQTADEYNLMCLKI